MAAISANDAASYPSDSFDNMVNLTKDKALTFPYLYDESQEIARAYGAACTPDFFGYNSDLELQYRGRLNELLSAMTQIADSGKGPQTQTPSMGCSIKWR